MSNNHLTPFQRHKQRVLAEQEQAKQEAELQVGNTDVAIKSVNDHGEFESLKLTLEQKVNELSGMSRGQEKTAKITEFVALFLPHVEAYQASGEEYANPVAVQVLIWLFDLGSIAKAVELSELLIAQKQVMPELYKRNIQAFVFDEIRDWAEVQIKEGHSPEPYFSDALAQIAELPIPDKAKSKYHKIAGLAAYDEGKWADAITHFEQAQKYDQKVSVKTKLAEARKKLT